MNGNIKQLNINAAFHQRCLAYTQNNPGKSYTDAAATLAQRDAKSARVTASLRKAAK